MLIADRCRVIFTAYVNSGTLNDFYNTLLVAEYNNSLRFLNMSSLNQRRGCSFNTYLIIKISLMRIKINSLE